MRRDRETHRSQLPGVIHPCTVCAGSAPVTVMPT